MAANERNEIVAVGPNGGVVQFFRNPPDATTGLLNAGVVTENEVRAAVLDLPPLEEGEALDLIDEPGEGRGPSAVTDGTGSVELLTVVNYMEAVP